MNRHFRRFYKQNNPQIAQMDADLKEQKIVICGNLRHLRIRKNIPHRLYRQIYPQIAQMDADLKEQKKIICG
jgi:type III secretion system FlhB-like substrate exporter